MRARAALWAGVVGGSLLALALLAGTPAAVHADEHEIAITDTGFDPDSITVRVGEPVTWTNATSTEHAILTADGLLDSGPIGPGEAFGHVFETPAIVDYYEGGNPRLRGTIVVIPAAETGAPSGSQPPTPPPGTLPPDFSPVAPSEAPPASPSPSVGATPSVAASPVVVAMPSGGSESALFLAVAVVGIIAIVATIAGLIGASRRPGR
jgi:plastocyanin